MPDEEVDPYEVWYEDPEGDPTREVVPKVTGGDLWTILHYEDGTKRRIPHRRILLIDEPALPWEVPDDA